MTPTLDPEQARQVPGLVRAYLAAAAAGRYADAAALFAPDAEVVDHGRTHTGIDAVTAWIVESATAAEHTTTLLDHTAEGQTVDLVVRVDGDDAGRTVTVRQRFTTDYGVIRHLAIEPVAAPGA